MSALFDVILPVFLVVGFGYLVCWRGMLSEVAVDGVMRFAQNFAVPVLLFSAMAKLDLGANFNPLLLISFYAGAFLSFGLGLSAAYYWLKRPLEDVVRETCAVVEHGQAHAPAGGTAVCAHDDGRGRIAVHGGAFSGVLCVLQQVVDDLAQLLCVPLDGWAGGVQLGHHGHMRVLVVVQLQHVQHQGVEVHGVQFGAGQAGVVTELVHQALHGIDLVHYSFDGLGE